MTQILKKKKKSTTEPNTQIIWLQVQLSYQTFVFLKFYRLFLNNKIKFYKLYVKIFNFEWIPHSDQLKPLEVKILVHVSGGYHSHMLEG